MKRFRHPIRAIREPFGTAGLIVAMIALVAALGGTALAAAKLNSTQKKEVEKIAKKFQGTGPAGAAGANGSPGAAGKDGTNGTNGTNGTPGTPGESVTAKAVTAGGAKCEGRAGSEFKVGATATFACNGKDGAIQPGETLPKGATETGTWGFVDGTEFGWIEPISFPIQLPVPIEEAKGHYVTAAEVTGGTAPTDCPGSVEAPAAAEGSFCMYANEVELNISVPGPAALNNRTVAGMTEAFINTGTPSLASGTWAVTAP